MPVLDEVLITTPSKEQLLLFSVPVHLSCLSDKGSYCYSSQSSELLMLKREDPAALLCSVPPLPGCIIPAVLFTVSRTHLTVQ